MPFLVLIFIFLFQTPSLEAYNPVVAEPEEQYAVIAVDGDPYIERSYLGDLEDAPDMYEFKTDVAISVRIQVRQRAHADAVPFGLIMVRQNDTDGGVEEVIRQNEALEAWKKERSYALGVSFLASPVLQVDLKPGTYRIEVSTPDNKGPYSLTIGEEASWPGFIKSIEYASKTQYHFGYAPLQVFASLYVFGALTILVTGYSFYRYRRYKKERYGLTA